MKECLLCHSCFGDHMTNCDRDGAKLVDTLPGTPLLASRYRLDRPNSPQNGINTRLMRKRNGKWVIALNHVSSRETQR